MKGEACWDGTYDLTEEQQLKYRELGLQIVSAMPIRNARKEAIGILAASSTEEAADYIASPAGKRVHLELAEAVGRVLIDVLQVARD